MIGRRRSITKLTGWCLSTILILNMILSLTACSVYRGEDTSDHSADKEADGIYGGIITEEEAAELSPELVYIGRDDNTYAECFAIDRYEDGSRLLSTEGGGRYLVLSKLSGMSDGSADKAALDTADDITVLTEPVDDIYLVSTASMDYFASLDALSNIGYASLMAEDWSVEEARDALKDGSIVYAGRYSAPDYELLTGGGCKLAIENTMIYHAPEVLDKLHTLGIATLIEYSSYEEHPMGRLEWIRFYGALIGEDERALRIFNEQCKAYEEMDKDNTGNKSVAFFYFTNNGTVNIRVADDYVPKMIELAGGQYIFGDITAEGKKSSINMTMEEFVSRASSADVLIYNSAIDDDVTSVDELTDRCGMLKDFEAVKHGEVYCTGESLYQRPMEAASLIREFNMIINGKYSKEENAYIYRLH